VGRVAVERLFKIEDFKNNNTAKGGTRALARTPAKPEQTSFSLFSFLARNRSQNGRAFLEKWVTPEEETKQKRVDT